MASSEKFIMADGVALRMCDYGAGDHTVLFLHGYLENADVWYDIAEGLSKSCRIVAVDLPGHGISEIKSDTHTMEFLADVVAGVITGQQLGKVTVVGHSLGGYVALALLERHAELLNGFVLFHSHPDADTPEKLVDREREVALVEGGRKELLIRSATRRIYAPQNVERFADYIDDAYEMAMMIEEEGIVAMIKGMAARKDRGEVLQKSPVPVMMIFGRYDPRISVERANRLAEDNPSARIEWLENSGHNGLIEEPDRSIEIISDFVSKL